MNKVYSRINWENEPSTKTPLNEHNLNKIDFAVDEIDNRVIELDATKAKNTDLQTLSTRVDNLILNAGDSSVEAADARVTEDGTVYDTLKNRLDAEHSNVTSDISQLSNEIGDIYYETVEGSYINVNGNISNFEEYVYFNVDVEDFVGLEIYFKTTLGQSAYYKIVDENGNRLSNSNDTSLSFGEYEFNVKIPSGAKYLMISCYATKINEFSIRLNSISKTISQIIENKNDLPIYDTVEGSYINANGSISSFVDYNYFSYDVENLNGMYVYFKTTLSGWAYYKIVDENGNRLSNSNDTSLSFGEYEFNVKIPSGAKYLMISCMVSGISNYEVKLLDITTSISDLYKLSTNNDSNPLHNIKETPGMIAIFKKYCCIGDSLASGEHEYTKEDGTTGYVDLFPFSWGQCIARATGATCYNLSKGGASTLSWINDFSNQLPDTLSDCYIIALGVNDPLWIELGDISDIDVNDYTNNGDTYYGYYAEIIQRIKEVQPKAKIFCFTQPKSETFSETRSSYNKAVRDIVNIFDNCYLLDFETYAPTYDAAFKAKYFKGGHMNAMGYQWTAYAIMTYIDWIINNNYTDFSNVAFIGTDYE